MAIATIGVQGLGIQSGNNDVDYRGSDGNGTMGVQGFIWK